MVRVLHRLRGSLRQWEGGRSDCWNLLFRLHPSAGSGWCGDSDHNAQEEGGCGSHHHYRPLAFPHSHQQNGKYQGRYLYRGGFPGFKTINNLNYSADKVNVYKVTTIPTELNGKKSFPNKSYQLKASSSL